MMNFDTLKTASMSLLGGVYKHIFIHQNLIFHQSVPLRDSPVSDEEQASTNLKCWKATWTKSKSGKW